MHIALHLMIWCTVINYALLMVWFGVFVFAHDWLYRLHSRWFKISVPQFDAVNYGGMAVYKIGVMLFCLVPLVAMHLVHFD